MEDVGFSPLHLSYGTLSQITFKMQKLLLHLKQNLKHFYLRNISISYFLLIFSKSLLKCLNCPYLYVNLLCIIVIIIIIIINIVIITITIIIIITQMLLNRNAALLRHMRGLYRLRQSETENVNCRQNAL